MSDKKLTIEEMRKNMDAFIKVHGETRVMPWQKEIMDRMTKPLKANQLRISTPKRNNFESRVYYGQHSIEIPKHYAIVKNISFGKSRHLTAGFTAKLKASDKEMNLMVHGLFPKKYKQTLSRRQFKKWAKRFK